MNTNMIDSRAEHSSQHDSITSERAWLFGCLNNVCYVCLHGRDSGSVHYWNSKNRDCEYESGCCRRPRVSILYYWVGYIRGEVHLLYNEFLSARWPWASGRSEFKVFIEKHQWGPRTLNFFFIFVIYIYVALVLYDESFKMFLNTFTRVFKHISMKITTMMTFFFEEPYTIKTKKAIWDRYIRYTVTEWHAQNELSYCSSSV